MKLAIFFVVASMAVMSVLAFQAFRQEMYLRGLKAHQMQTSIQLSKKEQAIVEVKAKLQVLKKELDTVTSRVGNVKKKKEEIETATKEFEASLQTCVTEKGGVEKKKAQLADSITQFQVDHENAKAKAQLEIQNLKDQILNRDKAVCALADMSNAEARKLCGVADT